MKAKAKQHYLNHPIPNSQSLHRNNQKNQEKPFYAIMQQ